MDAVEAVADDAGAQVADVHFFSQVGRGVVDNDGLRCGGLRHAEAAALQGGVHLLGQKLRVQAQVDEAGAGHFGGGNQPVAGQGFGHFLCQLARVLFALLGRAHHAVNLEIAEFGVFGRLQYYRCAFDTGSGKGLFGFAVKEMR